jgi:dipeptidyl aminopeptidase/acylaminoacyl peptidase
LIAEHPWSGETYLLWVRDGDLLAQRFDQDATRLLGETSVIARDVRVDESQRLAFVSASSNGVIVWGTGRAAATVFAHYRRDGARRVLNVPPPGTFSQPALSPDGRRLLFTRVDKGQADIYMHDLESGTTRPVTLAPQYDELSTWTPDGRSALHLGFRQEGYTIFRVSLEEGSEPVARFRSDSRLTQSFETPDGRFLITAATAAGDPALLAVPLNGSGRPVTLAAGAVAAGLSADGRWLIMATVRGARVTPGIARLYLEGASPRIGVLVPIEDAVAIRNDAREVYVYASNRELKAVPIVISEHSASVGPPQTIVSLSQALALTVSGDGQQIVAIEQPYAVGQTLRVLTHWEQRLAK